MVFTIIGLGNEVAQKEIEADLPEKTFGTHTRGIDPDIVIVTPGSNLGRYRGQMDGTAPSVITEGSIADKSQAINVDKVAEGSTAVIFALFILVASLCILLVYSKLKKKESKFSRKLSMG